jgi:hypothetical protein
MAMNPQNVLSQLRMMGDQQLQQYAAMHKNDPFIFPLAFQESQTRKQMRAEAQNAQQAPQQKVVDQDLAAMAPQPAMPQQAQPLPEDVGIGQLPAKNMEGMCGGGIVAFEEGGEVPRFQNTGLVNSSLYATDPKLARAARLRAELGQAGRFGVPGAVLGGGLYATGTAAEDLANMTPEQRAAYYKNPMVGALGGDASLAAAIMNAPGSSGGTKPSSSYWDQMANVGKTIVGHPDMRSDVTAPSVAAKAADPVAAAVSAAAAAANAPDKAGAGGPSSAAPTDGTGVRPGSGGPGMRPGGGQGLAAIPGLTTTATGTAQELQAMRDQLGQPSVPQSQLDAIEKLRANKEAALKADLEDLRAEHARQGKGMEGAEARAQARAEKLTKREGDLAGMSIMEAGLAIMSGSSPFALQNIGAGAQAGLKSYSAGIDKLQEARDKLDESFDKIEQFRMNRADMNAREERAAKKDIRATQMEADRLGLDALMKEGEMNRADARTGFQVLANNRAETYKVAANYDLGIQQIAAQRDIAGQRNALYERLHGGDLKAREEYGRIQRAVMQSLDKNPLYTNEPNENKKAAMLASAMQQAVQNNVFLSSYAAGIGFSKTPPPGAKEVFELPGAGG